MKTYELEVQTHQGGFKVEMCKYSSKMIYRQPTEEQKKSHKNLENMESWNATIKR